VELESQSKVPPIQNPQIHHGGSQRKRDEKLTEDEKGENSWKGMEK
jgi:hypothetical protein